MFYSVVKCDLKSLTTGEVGRGWEQSEGGAREEGGREPGNPPDPTGENCSFGPADFSFKIKVGKSHTFKCHFLISRIAG